MTSAEIAAEVERIIALLRHLKEQSALRPKPLAGGDVTDEDPPSSEDLRVEVYPDAMMATLHRGLIG